MSTTLDAKASSALNTECTGAIWINRQANDGRLWGKPIQWNWNSEGGSPVIVLDHELQISSQAADARSCVQWPRTDIIFQAGNEDEADQSPHASFKVGDLVLCQGYAAFLENDDAGANLPQVMRLRLMAPTAIKHIADEAEVPGTLMALAHSEEASEMHISLDRFTDDESLHQNAQSNFKAGQPNSCIFYVVRSSRPGQKVVGQILGHTGRIFDWKADFLGGSIDDEASLGVPLPEAGGVYILRNAVPTHGHSPQDFFDQAPLDGVVAPATAEDMRLFGMDMSDVRKEIQASGWVVMPTDIDFLSDLDAWLKTEPLLEAERRSPYHSAHSM